MHPASLLKRLMKKNVLKALKCNAASLAEEIPEMKIAGSWEGVLERSISPDLP